MVATAVPAPSETSIVVVEGSLGDAIFKLVADLNRDGVIGTRAVAQRLTDALALHLGDAEVGGAVQSVKHWCTKLDEMLDEQEPDDDVVAAATDLIHEIDAGGVFDLFALRAALRARDILVSHGLTP